MRAFLTNLVAMCNMQPAAKPTQAKKCEFCGGVKCFGACGAESAFNMRQDAGGQLVPGDGNESGVARDDAKPLRCRRDAQGR